MLLTSGRPGSPESRADVSKLAAEAEQMRVSRLSPPGSRLPSITQPAAARGWWAIGLTMLMSFMASFGYLYHRRHLEGGAAPSQLRALPAPSASASPQVEPVFARAPTLPVSPELPARVKPASVAAADTQRGSNAAPAEELPVRVSFRREAGEPGETRGLMTGQIKNSSDLPLSIDVAVTDSRSGAVTQARVQVDAMSSTAIGSAQGLQMHHGDQIVLKSAGFADVERRVF